MQQPIFPARKQLHPPSFMLGCFSPRARGTALRASAQEKERQMNELGCRAVEQWFEASTLDGRRLDANGPLSDSPVLLTSGAEPRGAGADPREVGGLGEGADSHDAEEEFGLLIPLADSSLVSPSDDANGTSNLGGDLLDGGDAEVLSGNKGRASSAGGDGHGEQQHEAVEASDGVRPVSITLPKEEVWRIWYGIGDDAHAA